jgi:hypothetical protein
MEMHTVRPVTADPVIPVIHLQFLFQPKQQFLHLHTSKTMRNIGYFFSSLATAALGSTPACVL